jgi:acyl carrier protein
MDTEIAAKVVTIVGSVKQTDPKSLRLDVPFDELGIDSLDKINILFEVENEFNIDVPDTEARAIASIGDIVSRLEAHLLRQKSQGA